MSGADQVNVLAGNKRAELRAKLAALATGISDSVGALLVRVCARSAQVERRLRGRSPSQEKFNRSIARARRTWRTVGQLRR